MAPAGDDAIGQAIRGRVVLCLLLGWFAIAWPAAAAPVEVSNFHWSDLVDRDGDGYASQAKLSWTLSAPDAATVIRTKFFSRPSTEDAWTLNFAFLARSIEAGTTLTQAVMIQSFLHQVYDFKLEMTLSSGEVLTFLPENEPPLAGRMLELDADERAATISRVWLGEPADPDRDQFFSGLGLHWDLDLAADQPTTITESVFWRAQGGTSWTLLAARPQRLVQGARPDDATSFTLPDIFSHGRYDLRIEAALVADDATTPVVVATADPSIASDLGGIMMETGAQEVWATLARAWWSDESDPDGDGYISAGVLHWDPEVSDGATTLTVEESVYRRCAGEEAWELVLALAPRDIAGHTPADAASLAISVDAHDRYDWAVRIKRVAVNGVDDALDPNTDPDLAARAWERPEDELFAALGGLEWTDQSDRDRDGFLSGARLVWNPDVKGGLGALSVTETLSYRTHPAGEWQVLEQRAPHAVDGAETTDTQSLLIDALPHNRYDFKLELFREGMAMPDVVAVTDGGLAEAAGAGDGLWPQLTDVGLELPEEEQTALLAGLTWSGAVDGDDDGYDRSRLLSWNVDVQGSPLTPIDVYEVISVRSGDSPWTVWTTTAPHAVLGADAADTQTLTIAELPHGIYDFRLDIFRDGFSDLADASATPEAWAILGGVKLEEAAADIKTAAGRSWALYR